jgi:hypothetical protein
MYSARTGRRCGVTVPAAAVSGIGLSPKGVADVPGLAGAGSRDTRATGRIFRLTGFGHSFPFGLFIPPYPSNNGY